jgi:phosphohistidine phosphatase
MELLLWRHCDAESRIPDDARELTPKGLKQAERVAKWLRKRLPEDVRVLVSPARRAQQTAQALTRDFETSPRVGTGASPQEILKAVHWPHGRRPVLVVGHQPTLGQTAALIMTGAVAEWSIKKGAVWWFEARGREEVVLRAVIGPDHV